MAKTPQINAINPDSHGFDVVIVGSGPAGLTAAIAAARRSRRVVVLERNARPGGKLPVTGGGHCNLSALAAPEVYYRRFGRQGRFMADALGAFTPGDLAAWLESLGLPCRDDEAGKLFPASGRATDVVRALVAAAESAGVAIATSARVEHLSLDAAKQDRPRITGVRCADGRRYAADAVVLACGGMTYPALGTTGDGYRLAEQAGYTIVPPRCALAGLHLTGGRLSAYAGLTLADAELSLPSKGRAAAATRGSLLITHEGLSGPTALDLSTGVSQRLQRGDAEVAILLNVQPGKTRDELLNEIASWRSAAGARKLAKLLGEMLGRAVAELVLDLSGLDGETQAAQAPRDAADRLATAICACPLSVRGVDGPEKAMVTAGGVSLKQVDPRTMRGKLTDGLYFAGELLDLDGPTGGYNLQWTFSSGHCAGMAL